MVDVRLAAALDDEDFFHNELRLRHIDGRRRDVGERQVDEVFDAAATDNQELWLSHVNTQSFIRQGSSAAAHGILLPWPVTRSSICVGQSRTGQYILIRCDGSSTSEITAELAQYEYSRQNCIQWVSSVGSYQKSSDCIATRVPVLARHSESVVAIHTYIQNPIKLQSLDVLTRPHYTGISTFYLVHCTKIIWYSAVLRARRELKLLNWRVAIAHSSHSVRTTLLAGAAAMSVSDAEAASTEWVYRGAWSEACRPPLSLSLRGRGGLRQSNLTRSKLGVGEDVESFTQSFDWYTSQVDGRQDIVSALSPWSTQRALVLYCRVHTSAGLHWLFRANENHAVG